MPLYTTKSKGIGLGLAVTKRITEAHNGSVQAESIVGQGSKFTVRIPTEQMPRQHHPAQSIT
ncbi:MAG: ATP-binding protein [Candidatus Bathyarchaeia archaeon]